MRRLVIIVILLMGHQLGKAISSNEVFHSPHSIFYVNPAVGQIKLRVKRNRIANVYVIIDSERIEMEMGYRGDNFDYFTAYLTVFDTTTTYYFILKDMVDSLRFPATGEFKSHAPLFTTPEWAAGKTYYSIFTDGFYNGNVANDIKQIVTRDTVPKLWLSYGGDLEGISEKIAYIDSLDPDIIILQPIFSASSNHKLNPKDHSTIDPSFGDTVDLRNLINEIHKRNKKIILSLIFTHTGTDFSAFVDVVKKGEASEYTDWYLIKSTPIKTSPPSYECWHADHRFPKLNLRNSQVENYILGYLQYWQHFGFDGFYIGEDEHIDPNFVKAVRSHLKTKYPDLLLLGSDMRLLTGDGFDGVINKYLTDIVMDYFVKNTITTSDFDREIRKIFFFNPPQANSINLVTLSNYNNRIHREADADIITNLYAFIFTCIGSPVILYGDEIGISDCIQYNPGRFIWDIKDQNRDFLEIIKRLIEIRKSHPQISSNNFYTLYINDITKVYAYNRGGLIVVLNSGDKQSFVELPAWDGTYVDLMNGEILTAYSQKLKILINPKFYRILRREI